MNSITGLLKRITFSNMETGFTVAKLQESSKSDLTMVVGIMHGVHVGESLTCHGEWKLHPNHGKQFLVSSFTITQPTDIDGIQHYLASGLIKGVGPVYAERIVATFGDQTLRIIDHDPEKLRLVPGIGQTRLDQIIESWSEQRLIRQLVLFLQSYNISARFAQKIYEIYGEESVNVIQKNPYQLIDSIWGIGFSTADQVALAMGFSKDSSYRKSFGLKFMMDHLSVEGHTCYPKNDFLKRVSELLDLPEDCLILELDHLISDGQFVLKQIQSIEFLWTRSLWLAEQGIISELDRLVTSQTPIHIDAITSKIQCLSSDINVDLDSEQVQAIQRSLVSKFSIITGGPGTGKSTITNFILRILSEKTESIVLAAPTGRAAKRLSEITGHKSQTIHSLLEYDFTIQSFKFNAQNPLKAHLVLVDESSMIDTSLMLSLLRAIPDHARLILVGDINQLPSVGPGTVLKDLIAVYPENLSRLTRIFRQSSNSEIVLNAHRINSGQLLKMNQSSSSDFFFIEEDSVDQINTTIVDLVSNRLPKAYGFDSLKDIQVLAPQNVGPIGTVSLNKSMQSVLNPKKAKIEREDKVLSVGDKVIQIRNNYNKNVFNGDLGFIDCIDPEQSTFSVLFDSGSIEYEFNEMDEIQLAYAVTVHKFQGSETPCVVVPIHSSNYRMLSKKLLYTAITRGKKLVVLVGSKKSIAIAIQNDRSGQRFTGLDDVKFN